MSFPSASARSSPSSRRLPYASKALIMDEPTAALTVGEVDRLFDVMRGPGIIGRWHCLYLAPP